MTAIWSIVLDEMCSEVVGSKRIMLPCVLPARRRTSVAHTQKAAAEAFMQLTEGDISVAHPRGHCKMFI